MSDLVSRVLSAITEREQLAELEPDGFGKGPGGHPMSDDHTLNLSVEHIPTNHTVVGYVAYLKVLDEDGDMYFAQRSDGLNDMEMLGMASNMADDFQHQLRTGRVAPGED